ncbi:hypothetical protein [Bradyrhizobium sp. BR 1433]|uniref:hypothetical protein n=1 Tax=Bradyrhizobium sp. BR 1433 TaxID=3447967 RepID=UPI003EE53C7A
MSRAKAKRCERTTYIRKVSDGVYEYGWHYTSRNFRKVSPADPIGAAASIAEALSAAEALAGRASEGRRDA